ncbi:DNA-binding protein, partial [Enterobacter roggenkampii]
MWSTVSELAGCAGVPATERGCRKFLDNLASKNPSMRRKRTGTKAFEYHIDSLPIVTQEELKNRYYKEILSTQQVSTKETKTSSNRGSSDNGKLALIRQCPAFLEREVGSLTDKQKEIADARAVLAMEVEKLRDAGMSRTAAVNYISIESRKGTLPAHLLKAAEMANARKGSSRAGVGTRSLQEWLTIFESTKPGVERMAML